MYVCVYVCVSSWSLWRGWADVGLWVAVCFLAKISYIGLHVKPRLYAWHSHRQSRSPISRFHLFQINERYDFFFIFWNSFLYKITVSLTMVIKRSPGGQAADGGQSTSKSTCEVPAWTQTAFGRSISIQHVQIEPGLNLISFGSKSVTLSMLIDLLTGRSACRSTQVKIYTGLIASTDLWPQEIFTFSECLRWSSLKAVLVPTSVIGGLRGSIATSDLVRCVYVCYRGHYEGLSRCRLVGSCVLPGKDFFT